MKIKTKKLSKIKLVIVLRLVKCSCTFPESGMLHVKRPLSPCTSSSTPTDTPSKEENEEEDSDDEEDFLLFVKKFQKFVKKIRIERRQNFNNGRRS